MSDPIPHPPTSQAEHDREAEARAQDFQAHAVYMPANYSGEQTGPGRWFLLEAHGEPLGYVWTDGRDGLGFIPTTDAGRVRTPEFATAFQAAAAVGTMAADVFDHWAAMASLGLSAGPIIEGDLDTLNQ